MNKFYIRKVDKQAVNKQISIQKETMKSFFDDEDNVVVVGKKSKERGDVSILRATDPRLGGDIKRIIKAEGDMQIGDFILLSKEKYYFELQVIRQQDPQSKWIEGLFGDNERHLEVSSELEETDVENEGDQLKGYNKIYYGIPGCGKSYHIENTVLKDVNKKDNVFRTTFYLDYSNSDFIGQIYPVVKDGNVTYEEKPGPFTKALERAFRNKGEMVYLVIEEINRGNAAAIFGDTFQLLDRLKEDRDGRVVGDSEYPVENEFIQGYFKKLNEDSDEKLPEGKIYIPHNLTLLATMNTSDQNVFPLDTAFKRRWDRKKIVTNWDDVGEIKNMYIPYTDITWQEFATTVNDAILNVDSNSDISISEDKQMGAYFVQKNMLTKEPNTQDKEALITFTSNVIDYLYNDVTKFDHSLLFEKSVNSYDKLYDRMTHYDALTKVNETANVGKNAKVLSEFLNSNIIDKFVVKTVKQGNNDEQGTEN